MKDLLLEIGLEELPARFLSPALADLEAAGRAALGRAGLAGGAVRTAGTPRRLALWVESVADRSEDRVEEILGPSVAQAKDAAGQWTRAAEGFARAQGVSPDVLEVRETERGPRLIRVHRRPGRPAAELLPDLLPEIVRAVAFPKSMVWEPSRLAFARPIRWIVALHGSRVIPFALAGVRAGRRTRGLRFHSTRPLEISSPERYVSVLRDHCVIVDPGERRRLIIEQIRRALEPGGGQALGERPDDLLEEVAGLVEHPVAVLGRFDERFLRLPPEVLTTTLRRHQKFFPVFADSEGRVPRPLFVGVRNGLSENQAGVREGYERVLAARLADAEFFFSQDRRRRLADRVADLTGVAFLSSRLTLRQKTDRTGILGEWIGAALGLSGADLEAARRAAFLAKADLTTGVVGEFPELQGIMGRIYAGLEGEAPEVARAIEEHHWPLTADGALPATVPGAVVSLADKLDTLAGNFLSGNIPTGSQDPYGLRRAAVGVLRVLESRGWAISVPEAVRRALENFPMEMGDRTSAGASLMDFFRQRWAALAEARGFRSDEIDAVAAAGFSGPVEAARRLTAVHDIRRHPDFAPLTTAYRRAANILRQAEKSGDLTPAPLPGGDALGEAESLLAARVSETVRRDDARGPGNNPAALLADLVDLRGSIDDFFTAVIVMDPDPVVRNRRLALLADVRRLFSRVADFSRLQDTPGHPA